MSCLRGISFGFSGLLAGILLLRLVIAIARDGLGVADR